MSYFELDLETFEYTKQEELGSGEFPLNLDLLHKVN